MASCEWCGTSFRPRVRTQRTCSKRCSGLWQYRDTPRRAHRWGKRPPVDSAHRKLRAELLPAAVGNPCPLCGRVMDKTSELDHIIARSQGGATTRSNCRIICRPCNRQRGNVLGGRTSHALAKRRRTATLPPQW